MPQLRICCEGDKLTLLDTVVNGYLLELHVIDSCLSQSWYDLRSARSVTAIACTPGDQFLIEEIFLSRDTNSAHHNSQLAEILQRASRQWI